MIFASKRSLDADIEDWHIACWEWLLFHLGGVEALKRRALVLPTPAFFPKIEAEGHARAEAVLNRVKELMGMSDWPCLLMARRITNAEVGEFVVLRSAKGVAATFGFYGNEAAITYDPQLLAKPYKIIATFAHELAHYRLHQVLEKPPGADVEPMLEELATEMAVAFHGFALMSANGAFEFKQTQDFGRQGWSSSFSGYLSEDSWVFALAVFLALRGETPEAARTHLKEHLAKKLDAACKRLAIAPELLTRLRNSPTRGA
jgi:hypothetical protein